MKPGFSLLFSMDGVSLLQRAAGGWRLVGSVAIGGGDPAPELAALRAKGERLGQAPLACKLVIPNEQIRYLTVATGGTGAEERLAAVQQALETATPYGLDELAYDLCADGTDTHVAAVAIETLAEAEAFASENGFLPASFVAAPGENAFLGEPFFGTARAIRGTEVEPDGIAVVITGGAEVPPAAPDGPRPAPQDPPGAAAGPAPGSSLAAAAAAPVTPAEAVPEQPAADAAQPAAVSGNSPAEAPAASGPQAQPAAAQDAAPPAGTGGEPLEEHAAHTPPQPALSGPETPAAATPPAAPQPLPSAGAARPAGAPSGAPARPEPPAAPAASVGTQAPVLSVPSAPPFPAPLLPAAPEAAPDSAAAGSSPSAGFASRRRKQAAAPQAKASALPGSTASASAAASLKPGGPAAALPGAPSAGAAAGKPASLPPPPPLPGAAGAPAAKPLQQPQAGKQHFPAPQPAGKRRYLGLALTAVLLLAMAAAALVTLSSGDTPVSAVEPPEAPLQTALTSSAEAAADLAGPAAAAAAGDGNSTAALPGPEPELLADLEHGGETAGEAAAGPAATLPEPELEEALDPGELIIASLPAPEDLRAAPDGEVPFDTDPAQAELSQTALYAATGIWQAAPVPPEVPPLVDLDGIYVASIDHTGLSQDAVALPALEQPDLVPDALRPPAAAGSRFDLDQRGLVKATPGGTLNPDGITIYLGKPPVVPPETPERPDLEAEAAAEAAARQLLLSQSRPRLRPEGLVEKAERARLGGLSRAELAGRRPRMRPASLKTPEQESQPPTAQAVATSVQPRLRPSNFANIVSRAQKNTAAQPAAAAAAPATVTPAIPTSASVARQATRENALNLRKINLIGVFGTPADRRALVRLASGAYRNVKVGDRLDGGRVVAIGDSQLRYEKRGRNLTLKLPNG